MGLEARRFAAPFLLIAGFGHWERALLIRVALRPVVSIGESSLSESADQLPGYFGNRPPPARHSSSESQGVKYLTD